MHRHYTKASLFVLVQVPYENLFLLLMGFALTFTGYPK